MNRSNEFLRAEAKNAAARQTRKRKQAGGFPAAGLQVCGAPERTRTSDARFRKPTLYPLSYGGEYEAHKDAPETHYILALQARQSARQRASREFRSAKANAPSPGGTTTASRHHRTEPAAAPQRRCRPCLNSIQASPHRTNNDQRRLNERFSHKLGEAKMATRCKKARRRHQAKPTATSTRNPKPKPISPRRLPL